MATASFRVKGLEQLRKKFADFDDILADNINAAVKTTANLWERRLKKRQIRGARGAESGAQTFAGHLRSRTGALRSSISHSATGVGFRRVRRLVSQGVVYAQIQEFGGTIRGNPWLTVPLPIMYRSSGTLNPRFISKRFGDEYRLPDGTPTFIRTSKKGNPLIGFSRGGEFVPLMVLKKSVTIPGPVNGKPSRFRFFDTWKVDLKKKRVSLLKRAVRAAVEGKRI